MEKFGCRYCVGMHRALRIEGEGLETSTSGRSKVLISAPANDADATVVYGVNEKELTPGTKSFQMLRVLRIV